MFRTSYTSRTAILLLALANIPHAHPILGGRKHTCQAHELFEDMLAVIEQNGYMGYLCPPDDKDYVDVANVFIPGLSKPFSSANSGDSEDDEVAPSSEHDAGVLSGEGMRYPTQKKHAKELKKIHDEQSDCLTKYLCTNESSLVGLLSRSSQDPCEKRHAQLAKTYQKATELQKKSDGAPLYWVIPYSAAEELLVRVCSETENSSSLVCAWETSLKQKMQPVVFLDKNRRPVLVFNVAKNGRVRKRPVPTIAIPEQHTTHIEGPASPKASGPRPIRLCRENGKKGWFGLQKKWVIATDVLPNSIHGYVDSFCFVLTPQDIQELRDEWVKAENADAMSAPGAAVIATVLAGTLVSATKLFPPSAHADAKDRDAKHRDAEHRRAEHTPEPADED